MRHIRYLLPILLALCAAGCAREPAYYVTDSYTGQRLPLTAQYGQAGYEQPVYGQGAYAALTPPPSAQSQDVASRGRGLITGTVRPASTSAPAASRYQGSRRGLFTSGSTTAVTAN